MGNDAVKRGKLTREDSRKGMQGRCHSGFLVYDRNTDQCPIINIMLNKQNKEKGKDTSHLPFFTLRCVIISDY